MEKTVLGHAQTFQKLCTNKLFNLSSRPCLQWYNLIALVCCLSMSCGPETFCNLICLLPLLWSKRQMPSSRSNNNSLFKSIITTNVSKSVLFHEMDKTALGTACTSIHFLPSFRRTLWCYSKPCPAFLAVVFKGAKKGRNAADDDDGGGDFFLFPFAKTWPFDNAIFATHFWCCLVSKPKSFCDLLLCKKSPFFVLSTYVWLKKS